MSTITVKCENQVTFKKASMVKMFESIGIMTNRKNKTTFVQSADKTIWKIPASCRCVRIFASGIGLILLTACLCTACLTNNAGKINLIEFAIFASMLIAGFVLIFWGYKRLNAAHIFEINKDEVKLKRMSRWNVVESSIPKHKIEEVNKTIRYTNNIQAITRIELRSANASLCFGSAMDEPTQLKMIHQIRAILWPEENPAT